MYNVLRCRAGSPRRLSVRLRSTSGVGGLRNYVDFFGRWAVSFRLYEHRIPVKSKTFLLLFWSLRRSRPDSRPSVSLMFFGHWDGERRKRPSKKHTLVHGMLSNSEHISGLWHVPKGRPGVDTNVNRYPCLTNNNPIAYRYASLFKIPPSTLTPTRRSKRKKEKRKEKRTRRFMGRNPPTLEDKVTFDKKKKGAVSFLRIVLTNFLIKRVTKSYAQKIQSRRNDGINYSLYG